jgi:ribose 5-phosphate isomerase A
MSEPKRHAGLAAAALVESGMTLGLGTGSTVAFFLEALAQRIRQEGLEVRGVPTSLDTEQKARKLGIVLVGLEAIEAIDLTVDGADEIDPEFDMIKGGGGALLREKVIASISRHMAVVVDPAKRVERLGSSFHLPVEVVPFALPVVERTYRDLGAEVRLRSRDGAPYRTDNGNAILDGVFPGGIDDKRALEARLQSQPGVVETGLFLGLAHTLIVGRPQGGAEVIARGGAA